MVLCACCCLRFCLHPSVGGQRARHKNQRGMLRLLVLASASHEYASTRHKALCDPGTGCGGGTANAKCIGCSFTYTDCMQCNFSNVCEDCLSCQCTLGFGSNSDFVSSTCVCSTPPPL
jgi:hypothetical protein